jgi:hypothetical protein
MRFTSKASCVIGIVAAIAVTPSTADARLRLLLTAGVIAGAVMAHDAAAQTPSLPADLPPVLKPNHLSPYLEVAATGVQIYTCGKNNAGTWVWNLKAPEAALFNAHNKQIGKHYAGPTWEGLQGGKIVGAVKASAPAPAAGSIPWLLLDVKSSEGSSVFTQAKGVLRISTKGGLAPSQGCDGAHANSKARVPYTATYAFLK